ncbi:hypothetical protein HDV62DRAFT_42615 [Trichoderma sp. SZMC 28011]
MAVAMALALTIPPLSLLCARVHVLACLHRYCTADITPAGMWPSHKQDLSPAADRLGVCLDKPFGSCSCLLDPRQHDVLLLFCGEASPSPRLGGKKETINCPQVSPCLFAPWAVFLACWCRLLRFFSQGMAILILALPGEPLLAFSTKSSATSAHGNGFSISLWFYKISKRPNEQFSTGWSTVFYSVLRYVILQALFNFNGPLVPQQKKKTLRHRSRCSAYGRYCMFTRVWRIQTDATKNTKEASQFHHLLPFYPFPFPVHSKERNKLRGTRPQTHPRSREREKRDE